MRRLLPGILATGLVLGLALGWLLGTQSGLDFVVQRVLRQVPVEVSIKTAGGRLAGAMEFAEIRVSGINPQLEIEQVQTRLRLGDLLVGRVALEGLRLRGVRLLTDDSARHAEASTQADWQFPEPRLPFDLEIVKLVAEDLSYVGGNPGPFDRAKVSLDRLTFEQNRWALSGLDFASTDIAGQGELSYQAAGSHELSIDIKLSLQLTEKKLIIDTSLVGNEDRIRLSQEFAGAVQGALSGHFVPHADWSLQGQLEIPQPRALHREFPSMPLAASLDLAGSKDVLGGDVLLNLADYEPMRIALQADGLPGDPVLRSLEIRPERGDAALRFAGSLSPGDRFPRVDGRLDWQSLQWPPAAAAEESLVSSPRGEFKVAGSDGVYQLDGVLALAREDLDSSASAVGSLDLSTPRPRFDLKGQWERVELKVAERALALTAGTYSLAGDTDNYQLESQFSLTGNDLPEMAVSFDGRGDSRLLQVRRLVLASASGELQAAGQLAWLGKREFEFDLQARNFNPGVFDPAWPGRLSLNAGIRGHTDAAGVNVVIDADKIAGSLRGQQLGGRAQLELIAGRPQAATASLQWGGSALQLNGQLGDDLDLRWNLSIPNLASHTPRGSGSLTSQGRLKGTQKQPMVQLQVNGDGLRYQDFEIQQLAVDGGLAADNEQKSRLTVTAGQLAWGGQSLDSLRISAVGTPAKHQGEVLVDSESLALKTRLAGGWADGAWTGRLAGTALTIQESAWAQAGQAELAVRAGGLDLRGFCINQENSEICVTARVTETGVPQLRLAVNSLPLAELGLLMPAGLGYAGEISGDVNLGAGPDGPRGDARFSLRDARIWQGQDEDAIQLIDFNAISGDARLAGQRLTVSLQGTSSGQEPLLVQMQLPLIDWAVGDGPVEGRFEGELRDLGALSLLIPDLVDIKGRLLARLQLEGTLASPLWNGEIRLQDAQALVPRLGLGLQDMSGVLDASGNNLGLDLQASSGGGVLRVSGQSVLSPAGGSGRFEIIGAGFLASDLPQAKVRLTPNLELQVAGRQLNLSGKVSIDEARIEPRDLSTAVQRSPDERLMSESATPVATNDWSVTSKVSVDFSDQIFFDGFGLQARIVGSLAVSDAPNSVTTATGELGIIDGSYRAYGKNLEIRRGRLLFTGGPLANPGLDLLAARTIRETIEAGVVVRATLRNPEISLYSDPSMPPPQVLSYLLVGQPLADIGGADQELVNDTAARLASAGGGLLAQQLGRRMGLEGLTVSSAGDGDQASLVIGKYLSPKLYASYGVGLFENINTLRLRYILSSRWTVRAETGLNQSIDLEYAVQK